MATQLECVCAGESGNLIKAAEEGCIQCCAKFIAAANQLVNDTTALMEAAKHGYTEIVKLLIPQEATMQMTDGTTALMWSAYNGHLEAAKLLIPFEANAQDQYGRTALMCSAQWGHLEIAKLLVPLEAKMLDEDGQTALMSSTTNGHLEIAKLLIEHEAGIKTNDGQTATTIAISEYHPSCLQILLANEAEREASQIPRIMLAAFDGDIRYLLEHQSEWSTKHDGMAVLEFALLGSQRKTVRRLAGSEKASRSFAEEFGSRFDEWGPRTLARRFLSIHASFMLDIAPAVHLMNTKCKSWLLVVALGEQTGNASHIVRAICTPDAELMLRYLERCCNEPQAANVLAGLKHVGFSYDGKTVENLAWKQDGPVQKYLASNPLKQAQVRRAEKEAGKWIPNEKHACWREIEAESAFNGSLLTGSRDAILSASRPPRHIHDHNSNRIRQKQALNRLLLLGAFRFMERVVQDMLDE